MIKVAILGNPILVTLKRLLNTLRGTVSNFLIPSKSSVSVVCRVDQLLVTCSAAEYLSESAGDGLCESANDDGFCSGVDGVGSV